ncbi:MAG: hypothetical protein U0802_14395 [Candidatus Binatia bacterium]
MYGPLTRTVEDAALVLDQVVGVSELDPTSLPHPGFSYLDRARRAARLRIGFSPDLGYGGTDRRRRCGGGGTEARGTRPPRRTHRRRSASRPAAPGAARRLPDGLDLDAHLAGREHLLGRGLLAGIELARRR